MDASEILQPRKRQTAFKLKIADLNRGEVIASEKQNFIEIDGKHVARVNIVANIIDKFVSEGEKKYATVTIDDASSQIRVKSFGEDISKLQNIEIGDTVIIIGSLRFFNNEIYILPEIIKRTEPEWLVVRKLEIEKNNKTAPVLQDSNERVSVQLRNAKPTKNEQEMIQSVAFNNKIDVKEEKIEMSAREKILDILRHNDEGIGRDEIILSTNFPVEEIDKVINEMLENAEIYEPKPGRIRLL